LTVVAAEEEDEAATAPSTAPSTPSRSPGCAAATAPAPTSLAAAPRNCWVVPRHAMHTYKILETFTAIEATHPPAEIHDRDHPASQ
jgi:hypothetical protein